MLTQTRFGLFPVRSPLLRESLLLSFPDGTEMVQFPSFALPKEYRPIMAGGFPHSEISGSKPVSGSPKLIAAIRVLHRLLAPRHPPCALISLITRHEHTQDDCLGAESSNPTASPQ